MWWVNTAANFKMCVFLGMGDPLLFMPLQKDPDHPPMPPLPGPVRSYITGRAPLLRPLNVNRNIDGVGRAV